MLALSINKNSCLLFNCLQFYFKSFLNKIEFKKYIINNLYELK